MNEEDYSLFSKIIKEIREKEDPLATSKRAMFKRSISNIYNSISNLTTLEEDKE